jgi:hypothetical protein
MFVCCVLYYAFFSSIVTSVINNSEYLSLGLAAILLLVCPSFISMLHLCYALPQTPRLLILGSCRRDSSVSLP